MDGMKHDCRCCGGIRDHNGKICLGCGTELARCKKPKVQKNVHECPGCTHTGPHQPLGMAQYRCLKCGSLLEGQDFTFVDTRPDVNAMKQERLEADRKKRAR